MTATVTVGINPDGSLNAVRVSDASRDPAFDDSVVRAIRLAAPFPPPPEKYRAQFADGVPVIFNLGALRARTKAAASTQQNMSVREATVSVRGTASWITPSAIHPFL